MLFSPKNKPKMMTYINPIPNAQQRQYFHPSLSPTKKSIEANEPFPVAASLCREKKREVDQPKKKFELIYYRGKLIFFQLMVAIYDLFSPEKQT